MLLACWVLVIQLGGRGGPAVIDSIATKDSCLELKAKIQEGYLVEYTNLKCIPYYKVVK